MTTAARARDRAAVSRDAANDRRLQDGTGTGQARGATRLWPSRSWSAACGGMWCCCCRPATSSPGAAPRARERTAAARDAKASPKSSPSTEVPGEGRTPAHQRPPDVVDDAAVAAVHARAGAHSAARHRRPETVLVIGFGVGNTTHAATLHPSIRRVEVADLSRRHPRARRLLQRRQSGRAERPARGGLRQRRTASPADAAARPRTTSSRWSRRRLRTPAWRRCIPASSTRWRGRASSRMAIISQWLPAYQVPAATTLAMIRAFVDVFPQAVLISGAEADLLLLGANDSRIEIDPAQLAAALAKRRRCRRTCSGSTSAASREIVGTFVGSAQTLAEATRDVVPVSDDRPIQEYGVRSLLDFGEAVPASIVDLRQVAAWCPDVLRRRQAGSSRGRARHLSGAARPRLRCVAGRRGPRAPPRRSGRAARSRAARTSAPSFPNPRTCTTSSASRSPSRGRIDEAIAEFREALRLGARFGADALAPGRGARVARRARGSGRASAPVGAARSEQPGGPARSGRRAHA